jgi:erythromycin esterase
MRLVGWLLILTAAVLPTPALAEDASTAAFVAWARQHAVPLPTCSAEANTDTLDDVASTIGNARVVALGEPAHGAHEPLMFRNCLFRYLVEQQGFTAIALESGLGESRGLQGYVAGEPGDIHQIIRESLTWGFWRYAENVELIAWMRGYNLDPAHGRKIRLYGIDMSGGDRSGEWRNARITLDTALAYLGRSAPDRSEHVRAAVAPFGAHFTQSGYAALSSSEQTKLHAAIGGLIAFFDHEQKRLMSASGRDDYDWARRNAIQARQLEALFRVSSPPGPDDSLKPDDYRSDAARDAAMADNVRWVLDREGTDGRIMVYAHNGHIANAPPRGGIWSIYTHPPATMGQHLRAALGDRMVILPIISAQIGSGLPESTGPAGTLDAALAATGIGHFLLDLRTGETIASAEWLNRDQTVRASFTTESVVSPKRAFDGVIFIARLTPAESAGGQ